MDKVIKIVCKGAETIPYSELEHFQGNLKSLSRTNYEKLRNQIIKEGFTEPLTVWWGKNKVGNGHQRLRVVKQMIEDEGFIMQDQEGNETKELPVSLVAAKNEKEFARKVLGLASQYGEVDAQGLYEYMSTWDIDMEELADEFNMSGIDMDKFAEEFFNDDDPMDLGEGDELEPPIINEDEEMPADVPTSQVRMVQLFFDTTTANDFSAMIEDLKEYFGTTNVTDTCLACVKESFDAHSKANRG